MSEQLGINPAMDELARDNGLGHWSCVSPLSYRLWVRSDGITSDYHELFAIFAIWQSLKRIDKLNPIGKDWQQPASDQPNRNNPLSAIQNMLSTGVGVTNNQFFDAKMYGEIVKGIADKADREKTTSLQKQSTLVQKPFDIRTALAIMSDRNTKNEIRNTQGALVYSFGETHPEKGSYTPRYLAKTTGNFDIIYVDSLGRSLDGNSDNDLIVFVWEITSR